MKGNPKLNYLPLSPLGPGGPENVLLIACVASVTVQFRSNERRTTVKDRSKMA